MTSYPKTTQTKKKKGTVKSERKRLIKRLDDLIRDYIHSLPDDCVCCGKKGLGWFHPQNNPYGVQVGHFISRTCYALRWNRKNVFPQCSSCNYAHNNNPAPFASYLIRTFGKEVIDELIHIKNTAPKITTVKLRELEEELKSSHSMAEGDI